MLCAAARALARGMCFALSLGLVLPALRAEAADDFTVDCTDDTHDASPGDGICADAAGKCTLRAALEEGNSLPGFPPSRIFLPSGRYVLSGAQLEISASLSLVGAGQDSTVIDGDGRSRVLRIVNPGTDPIVNVSGLTLRNGRVAVSQPGAGLLIDAGSYVVISRSTVADCVERGAGAAPGGGIANSGFLRLVESTVRDNRLPSNESGGVQHSGGGIMNFQSGTVEIDRSTISGNRASRGGGIRNAGGRLLVTNSTISGNQAGARGGGLMNFGTAEIAYTTITDNEANAFANTQPISVTSEITTGGGVFNEGDLRIGSSILARNTDHRSGRTVVLGVDLYSPDCFSRASCSRLPCPSGERAPFTSYRGNVVGIDNKGIAGTENKGNCDLRDYTWEDNRFDIAVGSPEAPVDPGLQAVAGRPYLADNGGPTRTHALLPESPAIDPTTGGASGDTFACASTDQRGFLRPRQGNDGRSLECDAGAFELRAAPAALLVVRSSNLIGSDQVLKDGLARIGYLVDVREAPDAKTEDAQGHALVVVSDSSESKDVTGKFRDVAVPVVSLEPNIFDDMKMTGPTRTVDYGATNAQKLDVTLPGHRLAAELSGRIQVTNTDRMLAWGRPAASALTIATLAGDPGRAAVFAYTAGTMMAGMAAPARRVGFFAAHGSATSFTSSGLRLFDAAVQWATGRDDALLVAGTTPLQQGDQALKDRLEKLGYAVEVRTSASLASEHARGKTVVVVSETVGRDGAGSKLRDADVPVLALEPLVFADLKMTGGASQDFGAAGGQQKLDVVSCHPLAAGLRGKVAVTFSNARFVWGRPSPSALKIATLKDDPARVAVFAYAAGSAMVGMNAPARRGGFFAGLDTSDRLTDEGWRLFDAAVRWAAGEDLE